MTKTNKTKSVITSLFRYMTPLFFIITTALFLTSCEENKSIVNNIDEREANEIIVYLATKGIDAQKVRAPSTQPGGGGGGKILWNIFVSPSKMVDAMAILNQAGLPRRQGTNLLELFAKQGLMTTGNEETIRYQAGLEEELKNTIRKIDGILDADVQISFPQSEEITPGQAAPKLKAAVYIKHQGVLDDPNNHFETKIKRLLAGSVDGLDFDNVSVISDRSRYTDLSLMNGTDIISPDKHGRDYVKIWSIIMTKNSSSRFRVIFFILIFAVVIFAGIAGYIIYKFYPTMQIARKEKKENKEQIPPEEEM
jgi:type III secretion protein J